MICEINESASARPLRATWIIGAFFCAAAFYISTGVAKAAAPITPSGLNTQVNLSATPPDGKVQHDITGGTRAGTNLFHSFADFNVPKNNIANFLNNTGLATDNILGRVTGGNISNVFGTLKTTGFGNANLFLMNPAGIVFGPNASLNVGGSVTFTTADYLRLGDNGRFNAVANATADAVLSTAPLTAYGFLGSNPGAITIQGSQLMVPEERGISLVGGNITIQDGTLENGTIQPAHLFAPNGQINLATTQSPGEFLQDFSVAANINQASFTSFGYAHLESGSTVDVSQTGDGSVSIRGGRLVLEVKNAVLTTADSSGPTTVTSGQDTIVLAPGSSILSQTSSGDQGPAIQIIADRIQLVGSLPPSPTTPKAQVNIATLTDGSGDGGHISLKARGDIQITGVVILKTDSVDSPPRPPGNAGDIELTSMQGNILLTKGFRGISTVLSVADSGNTGNIRLSAPHGNIVLERAGLLTQTFEIGRPGKIDVDANNLLMQAGLLSTENSEVGTLKPGGITVTLSGTLRMEADPTLKGNFSDSIIATATVSKAPAADINIDAKDIVLAQKSIINSATFASGSGGNLTIVADTLQITDGSQISSGSTRAPFRGSFDPTIIPTGPGGNVTIRALNSTGSVLIDGTRSGIFADTEGTGAGGTIDLSARTVTIQNGGTISAETSGKDSRATGGSIIVNATDQVTLTNGASITASSIVDPKTPNSGIANAGNIKINAGQQLELSDLSSIKTSTESAKANGGSIDIRAIDRVRLVNSTISTSVKGDEGSGGNIFIDPNVVVLQNSQIIAQAVQGAGGNITLTTPLFLADSSSLVSASSQFGLNGTVTIQSPTSNLSESLGTLPSNPSQAQALLTQRCASLINNGQTSSFVVAGHEQLPSDPGGWLTSSLAFAELGENLDGGHAVAAAPAIMSIADHDTGTVSLRRLTPAGFLMANFADSEATGCRS
jgi:filamentous hemagglutinin family protein